MNLNMNFQRAFSLLELMIAIAILAIITSIAYPLYHNHAIQTRRVQACQNLLLLSQQMELYHSQHGNYSNAELQTLAPQIVNKNAYYTYQIVQLTEQSYLLRATAKFNDSACSTLSLDQLGEKNSTGSMSSTQCWLL